MTTLLESDNSDAETTELKINKDFANIYNNFREKEELHKLKAKYGEDAVLSNDENSDSSSSSEDDDEMIQDPKFDKEFLITLACLKNDDPRIYDKNVKFFSDIAKPGTSKDAELEKKPKQEKSIFLRDYERKIIMKKDERFSSSKDENEIKQKARSVTTTFNEEPKQLKDCFKSAVKDEDDDDFLGIEERPEEKEDEKEDLYKEWLKGQEVEIDNGDEQLLKPLRHFWNDPNLDANEKFLRDYVLNNKYMDTATSRNEDLHYNHIIHDSDENLSEDEKTIQRQEEFERKYNFRFEEPDQEFIKRYPRTMENSMRRKDTRRSQKRAEVKQRKEEEKQRKNEELKRLKALKRKEIEEKIEKIKEITGNDDMCFNNVDFDTDFDPNEHDKKMKELFNDQYYANDVDQEKPEFPDIDEELDIERPWDQYDASTYKVDPNEAAYEEPHCEDPDFNMDADYDGSQDLQSELVEHSKRKKRKRRSKFGELLAKEKPKFDPKQFPSYQDYFDQYYSLDYEDMIGDLPCRFKYRKVVPNDYGLTVEEILMADDRQLNKWCSLRQALKHKSEDQEQHEFRVYKQKGKNEMLKRKILSSLYVDPEEEEEEQQEKKDEPVDGCPQAAGSKKHRRKKKSKANNCDVESAISDTVPKKKDVDITKDNAQNNSCDGKNDEKQDKDLIGKDVTDKNKTRKRKNKSKTDDDGPAAKKMNADNVEKKDLQMNDSKVKEMEKDNEKMNNTKLKKNKNEKVPSAEKSEIVSKKKEKNSKLNKKGKKIGKHKPDSMIDSTMMSLNTERLKMYGIKAKKFKNQLKYGNKKF